MYSTSKCSSGVVPGLCSVVRVSRPAQKLSSLPVCSNLRLLHLIARGCHRAYERLLVATIIRVNRTHDSYGAVHLSSRAGPDVFSRANRPQRTLLACHIDYARQE